MFKLSTAKLLPRETRGGIFLRVAALALTVASGAYAREDRVPIPRPDLSGMEPLIRREIEEFRAGVDDLRSTAAPAARLAEANGRLAEVYHAHEFHLAAAAAYRNARLLAPSDPRWAYDLGLLYQDLGRFEEALAQFGDVLAIEPGDLPSLIRSGDVELKLGRPPGARHFFRRALALSPESAAAHDGLGRAAAATGDHAAAVRHFEKALEIQPQAGAVHYALAIAYRRLGDLERARHHLELRGERRATFPDPRLDALARIPKVSAANVILAQAATPETVPIGELSKFALAHLGDTPGAIELLTAAARQREAEASPEGALEQARIHYVIAGLWIHRQADAEAIDHLRPATRLAPGSLEARLELASALSRQWQRDEAVDHYAKVLELDPRHAAALRGRAATLIGLGRDPQAADDFRRLLEIEPENGEPRLHLAMVLQRIGRIEEAEPLYNAALELGLDTGDQALAHANLAILLSRRGREIDPLERRRDLEGALRHLEAARRLAPENRALELQLAEVQGLLDRSDEAATAWGKDVGDADRDAGGATSLLLVTLDTTRADHLEPYGASGVETPALQSLARRGVVFERAYATTPVTLPSHASILTGLDPPGHGVRNNGIHYLDAEATTLTEILREEGYRTAAFVSAAVLERRYGLDQGFEVYDDDLTAGRPKTPRLVAERPAGVTVAAASAWLDDLGTAEPFFLWVHLFDPHAVYDPPAPYAERYRDRPYDGEIAYMDAEIGRLLAHPRLGEDQPVIVMAIADHGEGLGEHGEASHAMLAYDSTLHIPWIVRMPAAVLPAPALPLRLDHEVSQVDLLPTALDLLGFAGAASGLRIDGASQAPAIRSAASASGPEGREDRALYAETFVPFYTYGWARLRSLRRDGWKLIDGPAPELYHLRSDPGELDNRLEAEPRQAASLQRQLERRIAADRATDSGAILAVDAATQAKLRSLGYLSAQGGATPAKTLSNAERPDPKAMIQLHQEIERAGDALYRHDFELAARQLRGVLKRDPDNLTALSDLARALAETGALDAAIRAARRVLELDPESAASHLAMALLLAKAGEHEPALAAVEASLALDPRSLDARIEQVRALYRLERRDEAFALLEGLRREVPAHPGINVGYAELVELPAGELGTAEARLRAAVAREPYLGQGWLVLGRVVAHERPAEAAQIYRQGLSLQPKSGRLHMRLGLLLEQLGDPAAESHLREAAELLAEPPAALYGALAAVELRRGGWPQAEDWARRAVDRDPGGAEGWNQLAVALEEQERIEPALEAYGRALEARPAYWQAKFNLGLLLRRQSRFREAAAAFEGVLEQESGHAKSHYELGVLYGGPLSDRERSREHLRACLEAEPEHPRAETVRRLLAQLGG